MTSITVIVPTFNRAAFLAEALSSLTGQTRQVDEIIVWDDGSTDGTTEVVQAAAGPIRYFRSENGGKARALNAAMREAAGDLIWICDDDDIAMPDAAERLAGLLERTPEAGLAGGAYRRFRDDPKTGIREERGPGYWPDLSRGAVLRHLLEDIFLFQNATLVRREVYDRAGPFREDLARSIDYDMVVRLALRAPVVMTDAVLFHQRKHDGARGPASARHAAARSEAVWKEADRAVFARFREAIPLSLYSGLFDGDVADRAGRLQRACVYARRTDWDSASEDFEAAAAMYPETELSPVEAETCRRAMAGKHGVAEALSADTRGRLGRLAKSGPAGAGIVSELARGVMWRARVALQTGAVREAARIARFVAALNFVGRGRHGSTAAPSLVERDALPAEYFLT